MFKKQFCQVKKRKLSTRRVKGTKQILSSKEKVLSTRDSPHGDNERKTLSHRMDHHPPPVPKPGGPAPPRLLVKRITLKGHESNIDVPFQKDR